MPVSPDNFASGSDMGGDGNKSDQSAPLPVLHGTYRSRALGCVQPYSYIAPPGFDLDISVSVPDPDPLFASNSPASAPQQRDISEESLNGVSRRYPLLLLLHGLTGNHLTWLTQTGLASYAARYSFFIVCLEGRESWYTNSVEMPPDTDDLSSPSCPAYGRYEDDLIQDFLPHIQAKLPLLPAGKHWAIGGMSMGGYGAIRIALTHGRLFSLALSHSGAFEYPQRQETHPVFGERARDLVARRSANLFKLAEDALSTWPPARPHLYFDCGQKDRWLTANQHLHQHLDFIGYRHTYIEQPGFHTLPYWDRAIRNALPVINEAIHDDYMGEGNSG